MKHPHYLLLIFLVYGFSVVAQTTIGVPPNSSTLNQSANSLTFDASEIDGDISNNVFVRYLTDRSRILNVTLAEDYQREAELGLDSVFGFAHLSVIDNNELEGTLGIWIDSDSGQGWVYGGLLRYFDDPPDGEPFPSPDNWVWHAGYVIQQTGTTWYGDFTMSAGTTFSADRLTANSITTDTLTANAITSNTITTASLAVTGNASIGGTLNMNNNRIINVADGVEPTDAVNLRQLQRTQTEVTNLRKESRGGIAGVAALSAIPQIPVGSDGVLGFGVGTYKGESSVALGGSKRVNESTTLKFGISTTSGNGDVVGSFGIGFKW